MNDDKNSSFLDAELQKIIDHNEYHLMIYLILIFSLVTACSIQTLQFYVFCMTASKKLHNKMFEKLLKAQPRFFDINPSGRILNRFSKDMGSMDEILPITLLDVKWICCNLFCVFILVISIRPVIAIPTILAGILFHFFRRFYLSTSRHRVAFSYY